MGDVKVNFRFNLVKLVVLKALELRKGWYDARGICELTGLRYSTVHTHVGYWAVGMLNKKGQPVGLLKRTPSVIGRKLAWRYAISYNGKRWLQGVNPDLVRDVASKLVSRWVKGEVDYDIPGDEPLKRVTTLLKPNEPLDSITLSYGEPVYLKLDSHTILRWGPESDYYSISRLKIPIDAKWSNNVHVVFNALKVLLGDNLPQDELFIQLGLQQRYDEPEIVTPDKPLEVTPVIPDSISDEPEIIRGVKWSEVAFSLADNILPEDSTAVRKEKLTRLLGRAQKIKEQRNLENDKK